MRTLSWLSVSDGRLVDETGRTVLLDGINLGNWFVQEGYMWFFRGVDRSRRIRPFVAQLAGEEYARTFWKRFFDTFITEEDISRIAAEGFNCVRLPLDASLLLSERTDAIEFFEDGFRRIDECVRWCREHGLYIVLDLHCAPGGQTGQEIDNSVNDRPELLLDPWRWKQGLALWEELARRYRDEPTIALYDLLNEPVSGRQPDYEALRDKLSAFYRDCVAAIRRIDARHVLSIEGSRWASDPTIFSERFDDRMVIHAHTYGEFPDERFARTWNEPRARLGVPLLLGETGENEPAWCASVLGQAHAEGISTCFWTWKKMDERSPLRIRKPAGWTRLSEATRGGAVPPPEEARAIFDEFLSAIPCGACSRNDAMANAIRRTAPLTLRATDFDPGAPHYRAAHPVADPPPFPDGRPALRAGTGLRIVALDGRHWEHGPGFTSNWDFFGLELTAGDFVEYSVSGVRPGDRLELLGAGSGSSSGAVAVSFRTAESAPAEPSASLLSFPPGPPTAAACPIPAEGRLTVRLTGRTGAAILREVRFLR